MEHYKFSQNKQCEYFPCHDGVDPDGFNCLFCYCPLYMLGRECGGNFKYLESGIKDCSNCTLPHKRENYGYIAAKFQEIAKTMADREREAEQK